MQSPLHKLINGTSIALDIRRRVRARATKLGQLGFPPKLVSVVFDDGTGFDSAIAWYVKNQKLVAGKCGIEFEEKAVSKDISSNGFLDILNELNQDPRVTGVVMQRPFPNHFSPEDVQIAIHPLKDVEGMHPMSIGNVVVSYACLFTYAKKLDSSNKIFSIMKQIWCHVLPKLLSNV
mmetsp:Transcript_18040/g.30717  ORF Transcript_18040/g.30717 Transcript_18040/m.30717 type:complete len:177 (-) Transcript_18040:1363-1893(-)